MRADAVGGAGAAEGEHDLEGQAGGAAAAAAGHVQGNPAAPQPMRDLLSITDAGRPQSELVRRANIKLIDTARIIGALDEAERGALRGRQEELNRIIVGRRTHAPVENARQNFGTYFTAAVDQGYNLNNQEVQEDFGNLLMAVFTSGFDDIGSHGTVIGGASHAEARGTLDSGNTRGWGTRLS